ANCFWVNPAAFRLAIAARITSYCGARRSYSAFTSGCSANIFALYSLYFMLLLSFKTILRYYFLFTVLCFYSLRMLYSYLTEFCVQRDVFLTIYLCRCL